MVENAIWQTRSAATTRLWPDGVPTLWCPTLTHFRPDRTLDFDRITAHLAHLAPHARGWLVPGSTGEGWQLTDSQVVRLLNHVLDVAQGCRTRVLIGILRQDPDEMLSLLDSLGGWLCKRSHTDSRELALQTSHVCGFTVCPPAGASLTQKAIREGLRRVLQTGWPIALYQLPQVTNNEMSPETVAGLASEFPNFLLFKDTSGTDQVLRSGVDLQGVFRVRGAEGNYARWLCPREGGYDGLLLSTANVFAQQLATMIADLQHERVELAEQQIRPVEEIVPRVFELVAELPFGNAFTNANKALDHFMAHGAAAESAPPPVLCDGQTLPARTLAQVAQWLHEFGLFPAVGYLAEARRSADRHPS